jgi:hypothetical protein
MIEPSAVKSRQDEETQATEPPPLTEPLIVQCLSVSGFEVEMEGHVMHFVGWAVTPVLASDSATAERRIVMRFDMSIDNVRPFRDKVTRAIPRGH